jgi:small subunit ribosomal protein S21
MAYVEIRGDGKQKDELEIALQKFKKQIKKSNLMQELRRREHYISPSAKKKLRRNESIKRVKREARKNEWYKKRGEQV